MSNGFPLEPWTGEVVGEMHVRGIRSYDLAKAIGWRPNYLSGILNGKRRSANAESKIRAALATIPTRGF